MTRRPSLWSDWRSESRRALSHYVALGDRHSTTNVGTTGRVYYAGAPEPTDYDETDPGNVLIATLAPIMWMSMSSI